MWSRSSFRSKSKKLIKQRRVKRVRKLRPNRKVLNHKMKVKEVRQIMKVIKF